jgi:topoisomerase IA-like protein
MRELNAAYAELKEPERRAALDRELRSARNPVGTGLDKIRNIIVKTGDWLKYDPLGRIVAATLQRALEKQRSTAGSAPRSRTPSAAPSAEKTSTPPTAAPSAESAEKKSAPKKTAPKKTAAKKSAAPKKTASPASKRPRREPQR